MPVQFFMLRNKNVVMPLTYEDSAMLIHVPGIAENTISLVLAGHVRCARLYGINIPIFMHAAHTAPHHTTGKRCLLDLPGPQCACSTFSTHWPGPRGNISLSLATVVSLPPSPPRISTHHIVKAYQTALAALISTAWSEHSSLRSRSALICLVPVMSHQYDDWSQPRWNQTSTYNLTDDIVGAFLKDKFGNYEFYIEVAHYAPSRSLAGLWR